MRFKTALAILKFPRNVSGEVKNRNQTFAKVCRKKVVYQIDESQALLSHNLTDAAIEFDALQQEGKRLQFQYQMQLLRKEASVER